MSIIEELLNHNFIFPLLDFFKSVACSVNTYGKHVTESRGKNNLPLSAYDRTLNKPSGSQRSLRKGSLNVRTGTDVTLGKKNHLSGCGLRFRFVLQPVFSVSDIVVLTTTNYL